MISPEEMHRLLTTNTVVYDLPYEDYESIPAIRASGLKKAQHGMLAYKTWLDDEAREKDADDDATEKKHFSLGKAVHCALLEPDRWAREYVRYPGKTRRGKEWESFLAANPDKVILSGSEHKAVEAMTKSACGNYALHDSLGVSQCEVTVVFELGGMRCKARLDAMSPGLSLISDIKTTGSVDRLEFMNDAKRFGYLLQAGFYYLACTRCDITIDSFLFACLQSVPPYETALYSLNKTELIEQATICASLVGQIASCYQSGVWPGKAPSGIVSLLNG